MGRPSASYKRQFDRNMKEARNEAERRANENVKRMGISRVDAPKRRSEFKGRINGMFNALEPGDHLGDFGINAVVAKKNRYSVVTTAGNKYTVKELGGGE